MSMGHNRAVVQHRHGANQEPLHDNNAASTAARPQIVSSAAPVKSVEKQPSGLMLTARHGRSLAERPSAQVWVTVLGCCDSLRLI